MGVAESRVGDQQSLLRQRPAREVARPQFQQQSAACRAAGPACGRAPAASPPAAGLCRTCPLACGLPLTITSPRKASSLVARSRRGAKANRPGEVSISVVVARPERNSGWAMTFSRNGILVLTPRMRNSRSARSMRVQRQVEIPPKGRDLHQQRIVKGRDDRPRVTHAAVQPHPVPARRAIGQDFPVVRREFVFRVLGGDAALHRAAVARHFPPAAAD